MKEVEAGDKKILLAHTDGGLFATSANCPHYGVSLAGGLLCGDRVVCPWHKSVFSVTTGALLEPPALDGLARYPVTLEDGKIFVELSNQPSRGPDANSGSTSPDHRCFVLAGAGAASSAAAERLRELDFRGRIVMLSPETEQPYDRTKLSKEFLSANAGPEELPLRPPDFWERHTVERVHAEVLSLDPQKHSLSLSNGEHLPYDRLLLATGSTPRHLDVPGSDLGNIFTLRSEADGKQILDASKPGVRVAVVGGSFIALEVASCFAMRKMPVTVIVPESAPFAKQLGPEVGRILQRWHESHGVSFELNAKVARFEGTGVVRTLVLESGKEVPCDLAVVGVGVKPATDYADGLSQRSDGGIIADAHLQAAQDIYVAGDLAVYPEPYSGTGARIEHWRVAEQHGRRAAENMLGRSQPFDGVPFFWTNHFGTRFDYLGHAEQWDDVVLYEGGEPPSFLAYYVKDDRVLAASACQHDTEMAALHELFRLRRVPSASQVRHAVNPTSLLPK